MSPRCLLTVRLFGGLFVLFFLLYFIKRVFVCDVNLTLRDAEKLGGNKNRCMSDSRGSVRVYVKVCCDFHPRVKVIRLVFAGVAVPVGDRR